MIIIQKKKKVGDKSKENDPLKTFFSLLNKLIN